MINVEKIDEVVNEFIHGKGRMRRIPLPEAKNFSRDEGSQILKRNRFLKKLNKELQETATTLHHNLEVNHKAMSRMIEQREEALIQLSRIDQWKEDQKGLIKGLNSKLNDKRKVIKSMKFFMWCGWGAFVGACIAGFYLK